MAGDPWDRGGAARDEPPSRLRLAPRARLRSAQHRRPLGAVLGALLLGAISLLPTGCRHTPAGLCRNPPPRHLTRRRAPSYWYYCEDPQGYYPYVNSALMAGDQSHQAHNRHRVCSRAYPMMAPATASESPSARGNNPWRWRGEPGRGWRRDRPRRRSRWSYGHAGHLIPFGVHTLDIRHVISGLRSRCRGATCRQAARTSQDDPLLSSNS